MHTWYCDMHPDHVGPCEGTYDLQSWQSFGGVEHDTLLRLRGDAIVTVIKL